MPHEPHKDGLEDILSALRDEQMTVREQAIQRLSAYVNSAYKEPENNTLTQAEALEAWDKARTQQLQDSRIVEALLVALEDTSARVRAGTALLLGDVTLPEAQEAVIQHLQNDPHHQVRMMCVWALGHRPNSERKVEAFIAALNDPHYQVVYPACNSLGRIGDPQAIEPLRKVLSHDAWQVRFSACAALVHLKAVDLRVVNLLEELHHQPEAQEHNEIAQKANELNPQTTQVVLDQAWRLLNL